MVLCFNLGFTGFNPCYDGFVILTGNAKTVLQCVISFNPCYDGFVILTGNAKTVLQCVISFNPCYDGFVILTAVRVLPAGL